MSWLADLVDHGMSADELAAALTDVGIKVEAVHHRGAPDTPENRGFLRVGHVVEAGRHPDADRLSLCRVDVGGDEPEQIVCGAPNVATGQTVAVALPGAMLPGAEKPLKAAKLRGVPSNGMILSARELELSDDHEGIMVLDGALTPGTPLVDALPLGEDVIEFELPANRPDLLGVWGIAREVAAITGKPLREPDITMPDAMGDGEVGDRIAIEVAAPDLCPRYRGAVLTGVTVGESPDWLKRRLEDAGMRAISNVVDITNYVMLLTGQPLHAFDLDRLAGPRIVVRRAGENEPIVTLDGVERTLGTDMLAICDAERPAVIAGVFGAEFAEVSDATRDVVLEAATFVGSNILATSWGLGLRTESSRRFEKGLPPELPAVAMAIACRMLIDLAGATLVPGVIDVGEGDRAPVTITLRHARIATILGMTVDPADSATILRNLGCTVDEGGESHAVTVPFWRTRDLEREIDLIEEIGRHAGLDGIPEVPIRLVARARRTPAQRVRARLEQRAADLGYSEVITMSFVPEADADRLRLPEGDPKRQVVRLANPLSEEVAVMRRSLVPGLLRAAVHNQAHQIVAGRLFEVGRTYAPRPGGMADEREWITGLAFGTPPRDHWRATPQVPDFFSAKGIVEVLAHSVGVRLTEVPAENPYGHPGRQVALQNRDVRVGWVGEIHPLVARDFGIDGPCAVWGLDIGALVDSLTSDRPEFQPLLSVPASTRDLALVVDDTVSAGDVLVVARSAGGRLVRDVTLFDRYDGDQLPDGKVSLALRFTIADPEKTLTDDEIAAPVNKVRKRLEREFDAELRG